MSFIKVKISMDLFVFRNTLGGWGLGGWGFIKRGCNSSINYGNFQLSKFPKLFHTYGEA